MGLQMTEVIDGMKIGLMNNWYRMVVFNRDDAKREALPVLNHISFSLIDITE